MGEMGLESPGVARTASPARRSGSAERYVFGLTAVAFVGLVFAGFARSYYLRSWFESPPLPSGVVHLHGLVMTAWVALFVTQVGLISSRRVRLHQQLGLAGIGLAVLVVLAGLWTALRAAKYGTTVTPLGFSQPTFSLVPLGDLVLFVLFFGAAIYYRRQPATHKRMMLLTVMNFLPPAVARLPADAVQAAPVAWFMGVIVVATLGCVAFDRWRFGRVHRLFLAGALLLMVSIPLRIVIMKTQWWVETAHWLASLV